jgi:hypothetical protein
VDNFFTGTRKNVESLLSHKYFELIRHDVTFPYYAEVDEIFNLACPASPVHYRSAGGRRPTSILTRPRHIGFSGGGWAA